MKTLQVIGEKVFFAGPKRNHVALKVAATNLNLRHSIVKFSLSLIVATSTMTKSKPKVKGMERRKANGTFFSTERPTAERKAAIWRGARASKQVHL